MTIADSNRMTYDEFMQRRKAGTIKAGIDPSRALRLVEYLPARYKVAHIFWSWIWMLSVPAFISVAIFVKWWAGLFLLFFVTPMIFRATKRSAAQFVLEHAETDRDFFEKLVGRDVLIFRSPQE